MNPSSFHRPLAYLDAKPHLPVSRTNPDLREISLKRKHSWEDQSNPRPAVPKIPTIATFLDMETYNGHVRTPADAIILFEACRLGLLPRVQRRLSEKERQSIKSGSVFVWDEREAGMRRWTDGKSWSASRVSGSFLTYREMEGKRGGNSFGPPLAAVSRAGKTPDSTRGSDSDLEIGGEDGPDGYRYKPDGLMKQSFSITTSSGNHLHLISYYSRSHPSASGLTSPTSDPALRHIRPQKGMYPESTVHEHQNIPAVTRSPMASAPYSTVPQMAGYARQGPPQWPPHYNGYNWAPPPAMQQAGSHYGYQQYNGGGVGYAPPPPINGHSPLQNSQSAQQPPPTTQSYDPQYQAYDQRRYPSMSSSIHPDMPGYDNRQGPPTTPQQRHMDKYAPPPDPYNGFDPRYPPNHNRNPPTLSDSNLAPPQQPHSRNGSSANGLQQSQSQVRHPSPHMSQLPPNGQQQQAQQLTSSSTPIDPRLMASSPMIQPMIQQQSQPNHHSRTPTPGAHAQLQEAAEAAQNHANGTNGASTIPSIGAIMNGASAENHNSPNADARSDRSGDKTPGGSVKKEGGPQDIPSDKLGFGEDMRALKVLDRAFKT
ncbi:hypothetical protein IMSHALPRED_005366 [Imshaugia aleurites]|uniref:cAMP-independent regulatory protein pac2 n=1 Tax=Imshaugia aleurites TaxID=172621 RepID=A0A8H3EHT4_9LECA|nr:hypothetical protein IMSHALPRED_005366 [Imshaugia aleurites]